MQEEFIDNVTVVGFPCKNFGGQEHSSNADIKAFVVNEAKANFTVLGRVECEAGDNTEPLFVWMKSKINNSITGNNLKWNFHKYLLSSEGQVMRRYSPIDEPSKIAADLRKLL